MCVCACEGERERETGRGGGALTRRKMGGWSWVSVQILFFKRKISSFLLFNVPGGYMISCCKVKCFCFGMGGGGGGGRGWDDIPIGPPYVCVVLWENSLWFCYLAFSSHSPPHPFFLGGEGREFFYLPLTKSFSFFSFMKFIENRSCMYMYEYWVPPWWFERKMKKKNIRRTS